jgi:apolipoprotein D and lipocalin family protein
MIRSLLLSAILLLSLGAAAEPPPVRAIEKLDALRYLGTWYEIAKYPNRFQKQCLRNTRAEYARRADGTLDVLNRCETAEGVDQAQGQARQIGGPESAILEVRFAPAWLSWLPFVWGDYWVLELDGAYTLAAVGAPNREYLWILSRTPQVPAERYAALVESLRQQGWDPARLEITEQTAP